MAGRLRTQLKLLFDLSWAVHELSERVSDAAPSGVFSFENTLKRIRDEPLDEKTELWHDAQDGINECDEALARLHELLDERIRKLPTYRPPVLPPSETPPQPAALPGLYPPTAQA